MKIVANEFILPFVEGWQCHASHFVVLNDGRIFCVFFYGSKEGNPDVRIYGSFRTPDCCWSKAVKLTTDEGVANWNPVLHMNDDGSVTLFYKVGATIEDWVTKCQVSYDNCESWSKPFEMVEGDKSGGRGPVRNKIVKLSDGSLLAPGSTERGEWKCFFDRSVDGGNSWQRSRDLCLPIEISKKNKSLDGKGIIQPTIWQDESGIHAFMRSTEGTIYRTDSADALKWCDPYPTNMPNNNSGIDIVRLPDGRLILACNPVAENWGSRTPLSLFVSTDGGNSFSLLTHLITMQGKYAYPAMRYENGLLHITFTWNRQTIQYICLGDL